MNYRPLALLCALGLTSCAYSGAEISVPGEAVAAKEQALLSPAQLDELLSPVALYPDPLIAIILPASTFPAEIVLAARYLDSGGDPEAVESQPWDDSVKSLARYPEVVKWMDKNLDWTSRVGAAFAVQPADLLTSTQRLRAAARAAGNLDTTAEQTVFVERETIRIVPARPEVIYVPVYDPVYVYRPRVVDFYHPGPLVRFSTGYRTGFWLSYHCDWGYRTVVVIERPHRVKVWHTYPRWSCPVPSPSYHCQVWRPSPARVHALVREHRRRFDDHRSWSTPASSTLSAGTTGRTSSNTPRPAREALPARPSSTNTVPAVTSPVPAVTSTVPAVTSPVPAITSPVPAIPLASSTVPSVTRPSRLSDPARRRPPPETPVTPAAPSSLAESIRHNRRLRDAAPAPSPAPSIPSATIPSPNPEPGSGLSGSRRIQNSTSGFRSRSPAPAVSGALSAPAASPAASPAPVTPAAAAPRRRERDIRSAPAAPSVERSSVSPGTPSQPGFRSRTRTAPPPATPSPVSTSPEEETNIYGRRSRP